MTTLVALLRRRTLVTVLVAALPLLVTACCLFQAPQSPASTLPDNGAPPRVIGRARFAPTSPPPAQIDIEITGPTITHAEIWWPTAAANGFPSTAQLVVDRPNPDPWKVNDINAVDAKTAVSPSLGQVLQVKVLLYTGSSAPYTLYGTYQQNLPLETQLQLVFNKLP